MEFLRLWEIIIRRRWTVVITFCALFFVIAVMTAVVRPSYKAEAKLLVGMTDTLSSIMTNMGFRVVTNEPISEGYETDIALAEITPLLNELISALDLHDRYGDVIKPKKLVDSSLVVNKLLPQPYLDVDQYEDADMLKIKAYSPDPVLAAGISNALAELYIKDRIKRTREDFESARAFIDGQILKVRDEYYRSLTELVSYKTRTGIVDLDTQQTNLIDKINDLKNDYDANEKTIIELDNEVGEIERKLSEIEAVRKQSEGFAWRETLRNLKGQMNDLLVDISEVSIDYTKEHPEYKQLEKQVETVRDLLKKETRDFFENREFSVESIYDDLAKRLVDGHIDREVTVAKRRLIERFVEGYQAELMDMPLKGAESTKLDLIASAHKENYQGLLKSLTQLGVAEAAALSNIKLVEPAVEPDEPAFPKKSINYPLGVFLGLFWGLALALFRDYIDNTIRAPGQIKSIRPGSLLGTIPFSGSLKEPGLVSSLDPAAAASEAFRTVKNNMQYAIADEPIRSVVVTSSVDSEGKTTAASNIAATLGREKKRVVVVDLNLRRPAAHRFFKLSGERGVTDVVTGGVALKDALQRTSIDGVDLLSGGTPAPDPGAVIGSESLKELVAKLTEGYDLVIMDTPPLSVASDAVVAGRLSGGILLVIGAGQVTLPVFEDTLEAVDKAGAKLVGVVLNRFRP